MLERLRRDLALISSVISGGIISSTDLAHRLSSSQQPPVTYKVTFRDYRRDRSGKPVSRTFRYTTRRVRGWIFITGKPDPRGYHQRLTWLLATDGRLWVEHSDMLDGVPPEPKLATARDISVRSPESSFTERDVSPEDFATLLRAAGVQPGGVSAGAPRQTPGTSPVSVRPPQADDSGRRTYQLPRYVCVTYGAWVGIGVAYLCGMLFGLFAYGVSNSMGDSVEKEWWGIFVILLGFAVVLSAPVALALIAWRVGAVVNEWLSLRRFGAGSGYSLAALGTLGASVLAVASVVILAYVAVYALLTYLIVTGVIWLIAVGIGFGIVKAIAD